MASLIVKRVLLFNKPLWKQISASYAAPAKAKDLKGPGKKRLPVETDPVKLTTHVCGLNYNKVGEEILLKADEEYPDWLWTLRMGIKPTLDELDPDTIEYWERATELQQQRQYRLMKVKQAERLVLNQKDKLAELKDIRFRALAGFNYNVGIDKE